MKPLILAAALVGIVSCVTTENADTFTPAGLLSGSVMTEEACGRLDPDTTLWLMIDGQGECIRYFHVGLKEGRNELVHIWLDGDRMAGHSHTKRAINYRNRTEERQRRLPHKIRWKSGLPSIAISRPGTFGSSGFHDQRRRPRNVAIVLAAIDALKERYGIEEFAVSGQSGGGHLVGAVLADRDDILCAVTTSGALAVNLRIAAHGWTTDATGYTDSYDPIDHVSEIPIDRDRRIFIIGDPRDTVVPFSTQRAYYRAVRAAGHDVWLISTREAHDREHHRLTHQGHKAVKYCSEGMSSAEIVQRLS